MIEYIIIYDSFERLLKDEVELTKDGLAFKNQVAIYYKDKDCNFVK